MAKLEFRDLRADEVDVRVGRMGENYLTLLLYKDARCDMNILDETVGAMNWQRRHLRENANCVVSIWDSEKETWVDKEDTGVESNTEKEKGLASDSFKRACTNWGIGRELYTAPSIFVFQNGNGGVENYTTQERNGKLALKSENNMAVEQMVIEGKRIVDLVITNTIRGSKRVIYEYHKTNQPTQKKAEKAGKRSAETKPEYSCVVCGREVNKDMALKSLKKYGVVLDCKECADKYKEGAKE